MKVLGGVACTSDTRGVLLLLGAGLLVAGDGAMAMVYVSELCFCFEHSRDNATLVLTPGKLGLWALTLQVE